MKELARVESRLQGAEKLQAIEAAKLRSQAVAQSQSIESAKASSMEAAQSISDVNRLGGPRQESVNGESSHGNTQQGKENRTFRHIDSRQAGEIVEVRQGGELESQSNIQEQGTRQGQLLGKHNQHLSKEKELDHQLHQSAIPRTSDLPANIHHVQNRQID